MKKILLCLITLLICWSFCNAQTCNNWLFDPSVSSSVNIGDLDVSGDQITVEATINRTQPYLPGVGDNTEGDVVSKHNSPSDVNYLLRPNHAYITTSNGFFGTPDVCNIELNKTYHIAMVYDGVTLKYYRNGFLMSQVPATGSLFQNNWATRFGHYEVAAFTTQFIGYINEVKIWNVARTQAQIRSYMNTSLPNPSTQTGLLAYYTFDNLLNKQGNATYNGNLNGSASINNTNSSCALIIDSCKINACSNWLGTPSSPSYASIGQLNVTGNKITLEATFNRTAPFSFTNGLQFDGDLITKYNTPADVNYLLRVDNAQITTSDGFFMTPKVCDIELNKTYHAAMVYDGSTLKFYRNGFLMSQVAATGTLFQNSWDARIGFYEPSTYNTNLIGFINEARIWNIARTQAEIQTYMNSSLPAPATQPGLLAYYIFDNLLNKQGNAAYNAVLGGSAAINQTNSNCAFIVDSCAKIVAPDSIIINSYTPVFALDPCKNNITVEDASTFNAGDTVLIIQMKGAVIDSSNNAAFGSVTNYNNAGNYEFNYVKSKSGNVIELLNSITRLYDIPAGKVQLVRVPYFNNAAITSTLTCLPWDGSKGGVLALNAKDSVVLNANIDVTGRGFRGGNSPNTGATILSCFNNDYTYPAGSLNAAAKGEGITSISDNISWGKGAPANAGGGGDGHNAGGGGGANGGNGGLGGYQLESCGNAPFDNRGTGGKNLTYSNLQNKIFMGGGGGSGHVDNAGGSPMQGGAGGAIVIINAKNFKANNFNIIAKGGDAPQCTSPPYGVCHDGNGGGGAGGTILVNAINYLAPVQFNAAGGKGADLSIYDPANGAGRIGPGGGGGAGITWINQPVLPAAVTTILTGGINGVIPADNNNPWGTTAGAEGVNFFSLQMPVDGVPFKKNIDSVSIRDSATNCSTFDFKGLAYIIKSPVTQWFWDFGDGNTANTQNSTHAFANAGTFTVSLVVTDKNGCKDSSKVVVITSGSSFDFSYKQDVCNPLSVQFFSTGALTAIPAWSFGDGSTVLGNANPVHSYAVPGTYTVKLKSQNGACTDSTSKNILVSLLKDDIILTHDTTICFGTARQLFTKPSLSFCWTPVTYLNDPLSANPITTTPAAITYFFTAEIPGVNMITNGDFNAGNTGFTSQYSFANPNLTEGQYFVGPSPQAWNPQLSNCSDHTTGSGSMLLVNGAPVPNVSVWAQTVTVVPNTNYAFSTWIQSLYPPNPAQLSFSINGSDIGTPITAVLPNCTWTQFYTTWNSGTNTSASISIVNKNTFVQGNDFALDDISFSPVLTKRDSVVILIDTPRITAGSDTAVCAGNNVQLSSAGAASYNWSPATGLNNAGIANPVATPVSTTQYIVTGTTSRGCIAADTVVVTAKPLPLVTATSDTTICQNVTAQLWATGGVTYQWSPAGSLTNAAIPNPVASPLTNTLYQVVVTGTNACTAKDSVAISLRPAAKFAVSPPDTTCFNMAVQLLATGGDVYVWSPAAMVTNANIANPLSAGNADAIYTVSIKENICNTSATLTTSLKVLPVPVIKAAKSNDLNCTINSAQLSATGATYYSWSPATELTDSTIANPIASPETTTQYTVTGKDLVTNCTASDNITVIVNKGGEPKFFIPSAFSPNGDGMNDCFRITHFNYLKSVEISIYNRFGNMVYHSTTDNDCWDGTYKGNPANPGNYVYYIKTQNDCEFFYKKGNLILIR